MKALAIDVGGSHVMCGVVKDRSILVWKTIPAEGGKGFRPLLKPLEETLKSLLAGAGVTARSCLGLAIAFCGLVDPAKGKVLSTDEKYSDAPRIDLKAWCRSAFGLPLRIENDARVALLGEWAAGAARGFNEVVMITLGTGIGGAAMIQGRLLHGKHFQAGCLGGHIPVVFNGRRCSCGSIGCAQAEASTWALEGVCGDWPGFAASALARENTLGFEAVFRRADRGDRVAAEIRDRCLHIWAANTVGLIHAYDPEVVVIGGAVMKRAAEILPFVESYVHAYAWTPWGKVQVRAAELGDHAALHGAIPLLKSDKP